MGPDQTATCPISRVAAAENSSSIASSRYDDIVGVTEVGISSCTSSTEDSDAGTGVSGVEDGKDSLRNSIVS